MTLIHYVVMFFLILIFYKVTLQHIWGAVGYFTTAFTAVVKYPTAPQMCCNVTL